MKAFSYFTFILALVGVVVTPKLQAQAFTTLYNFSATNYDVALGYVNYPGVPLVGMTNFDGANPSGTLILAGNTLYGTAFEGGSYAVGTVFAVGTNGTGFTNLYNFTDGDDGGYPYAGLVLGGTNLYGTAPEGGDDGWGAVFEISTNGIGFATLYSFTDEVGDGLNPESGLVFSNNTLYGMALGAHVSGPSGIIFEINTSAFSYSGLLLFQGTREVIRTVD